MMTVETGKRRGRRAFVEPAYCRIENDLRKQIESGRWGVGAMLPSRADLARDYGVALGTMQMAIANLLSDGTLRAERRRGTFVDRIPAGVRQATGYGSTEDGEASGGATSLTGFAQRVRGPVGILARLPQLDNGSPLDSMTFTILKSMERCFSQLGVATRFCNLLEETGEQPISLNAAYANLREDGAVGVALVDIHQEISTADKLAEMLELDHAGTVMVTARHIDWPIPHVYWDSRFGGYQAGQHLIRQGWKDLLFLAPATTDWLEERINGVVAAVGHNEQKGASFRLYPDVTDRLKSIGPPEETGYSMICRALSEGVEFTGLVAGTDQIAYGAMRALEEAGKCAGVDYGIVGFDDDPRSRVKGLTSVHPPLEGLGEAAARLLLRTLSGEGVDLQVHLRSHLLVRASTLARKG